MKSKTIFCSKSGIPNFLLDKNNKKIPNKIELAEYYFSNLSNMSNLL